MGSRVTRARVHQHLIIRRVVERRDRIDVRVETAEGIDRRITFFPPDPAAFARQLTTLRVWARERTPLTYVKTGSDGALLDDRALFERAMGADAWPEDDQRAA